MSTSIADLLAKQSKKHDEKVKVLSQEQTISLTTPEADVTAIQKSVLDLIDTNMS
jgi:hypothetical protein